MSSERNKRSFREIPTISEAKVSERAYAESPEQAQKELEESVRDFTQKTHEEVNRLRREIGKGKSIPGLSQDSVDWSTFASGWHGAKIDKLQDKVSQLPNSPVRTQLQELLTDIQDGSLDEKIPEAVTTTEQEPWKKMTLDQVKNMLEIDRPGVMENLTYHPGVEHFRTNEGVVISDDDGPRPGNMKLAQEACNKGIRMMFFVNYYNAGFSSEKGFTEPMYRKEGQWEGKIKQLLQQGHDVYNHTAGHTNLHHAKVDLHKIQHEYIATIELEERIKSVYYLSAEGKERYDGQVARGERYIRLPGGGALEDLLKRKSQQAQDLYIEMIMELNRRGMTRLNWTSGLVVNGKEGLASAKEQIGNTQPKSPLILTHAGNNREQGRLAMELLRSFSAQ